MRKLVAAEIERLRGQFGLLETMEQRIEYTSRTLTDLTHGVGLAASIPRLNPALDQVELIALPERRVLVVVVTKDHQVSNRVVTLEESLTSDELASIRNYINRNFTGWSLENVRRELAGRLARAEATYDAVLQKLTVLYSKGLLDIGTTPEVRMDGASNLVVLDLHLTKEKCASCSGRWKKRSASWNFSTGSSKIPPAKWACMSGWKAFIRRCGSFR